MKGAKGYKFWNPEAQKVVISRDIVFDEMSMLKAFREDEKKESEGSGNKKSVVQVVLKENEIYSEKESSTSNQDHHIIAKDKPRRNTRPPVRYGFKDFVSYALVSSSKDPSTFWEAINYLEKSRWMEAMIEEIELLHKNKTWELLELPKGKRAIG